MASRLLTAIGQALAYFQPMAYRVIAVMTDEDSATWASWPTITAGSAVPSETQPSGSVYFRTNGTVYVMVSTTWTAVAGLATVALTALGALTPAADKVPYFTSGTGAALADFTSFGRGIVAAASYPAIRTLLGLGTADSPTFAALVAATFTGNVTGNVTGNSTGTHTGAVVGNADTATLATTASTANSIAASGAFTSTEQTGTGASQNVAHGFGQVPRMVWWSFSDLAAGLLAGPPPAVVCTPGAHDATNAKFTVTSGVKFYVFALK